MGRRGVFWLACAWVCVARSAVSAGPAVVKIAVVCSVSTTAQGRELLGGVQMAVDQANQQPGILPGTRIELIQEDDQADPKLAADLARKLAADPQVVCVIGHPKAAGAGAAEGIYAESGLSMVEPFCTDSDLTKKGLNNVFRLCVNDEKQGRDSAGFVLRTLRRKKIVVLRDNSPEGDALASAFRDELKERGVRPLSYQQIDRADIDNPAFMNRLRGFGPNFIYFAGSASLAARLKVQIEKIHLLVSFMGGDKLLSRLYLNEADDAALSTIISFYAPDLHKTRRPALVDFRREYVPAHGAVTFYAPLAYDAAQLVLQALHAAGKPEREAVRKALAASDFKGLGGSARFDAGGDNTAARTYFYVVSRNSKTKKIGFVFYSQPQ